jgi:phage baseplate assembly protein W
MTNILLTPVGSRFFNTEFGSFIDALLHEPMTNLTSKRLEDASIRAIQRWEPRVIIKKATITPDYVLQSYTVEILAELRGQSNSQFEFKGQLQPRQFTLGI